MTLMCFDSANVRTQEIRPHSGGRGGYFNMEGQADLEGGFAGASFELGRGSAAQRRRLEIGHRVHWWVHGRPIYSGIVVSLDKTGDEPIQLSGNGAEWKKFPTSWGDTGTISRASDAMGNIVVSQVASRYGIETAYWDIDQSPYNSIPQNQSFYQSSTAALIDWFNAFEAWEYGVHFRTPGYSLSEKPCFFYRAPDNSTLHYTLAASSLKERPRLEPDWEKFANEVIVYYGSGSPPSISVISGTAESQARYPITRREINISGHATTSGNASQVAAAMLGGLKVEGIETPPLSTELTLDWGTQLSASGGGGRDIYAVEPGQNILVTGLMDAPRSLAAVDQLTFLKARTVKWTQAGQVTVSARRYNDPAALMARLKGAA